MPKSHSCLGTELDSNTVSCLPNVAQSRVFNSSNRTVTLQKATSCSPPGPLPKSLQERSCLRALPSPVPWCPAPSTGPGTEQLLHRPCTSTTVAPKPAVPGISLGALQKYRFLGCTQKTDSDSGMRGGGGRPGICVCIEHPGVLVTQPDWGPVMPF